MDEKSQKVGAVTIHSKKPMSDCLGRISTAWRECARTSAGVVLGNKSTPEISSSS
jgi:hypothetical protein